MFKPNLKTWPLALCPLLGAGIVFGLWRTYLRPHLITVVSPDGKHSVTMVKPSAWQLYKGERPSDLDFTFYVNDLLNTRQIAVGREAPGGLSEGVGEPTDVWWRSDSRAFLLITHYPDPGGRYAMEEDDVSGNRVHDEQVGLIEPLWVTSLLREKSRNGTPSQKTMSQQFQQDVESVQAYIRRYRERRLNRR